MRALEVQRIPVTRRFPLLRRQRLALCVLTACLAPLLLLAITPAHAQTAAVVTTQTSDRTVAEGDASNTAVFTVALATQPSHDVTVMVTTPAGLELDGPDSATAFTGSESLTFTAGTWNSPQTVTVRAVEDSTDSPRSLSVQYRSTSGDSNYNSRIGTAATITVIDNDPTYVRVSAHFRDIAEGETKDITVVLRRGLVRGEALSVPLMFIDFGEKVAIYNTDFTLTCPSGLPTGVTCSGFETTVPTVTFTGPGSGATATSFTLTLTATRDNIGEAGGEDVFLFDPAPRTTGLDGGLIVVPDVPVFSITDSAPTSPGATAPRVTIAEVPGKINGTAPFTATFTFSQAVTGFTTDDVTVAGGAKGTFSAASATRYTLVVTPAGGSDAVVTVRAGAATGSGRTGPASAVSARATWDATPPTLSITGVPAAIGSTASFTATFTFSEGVTGFNTDDVTVDGGSAGAVSGSGDEYTATITPEGDADVTVTVRADAATDGANAGPASAESATAVWDDSQPAAVIVSGSPVSLVEGGDAGSYTVALATDPGGVVTVTPSSSDPGAVAVSGALTLTSTNWNEPQTVTVSAVDDGDRADESVVVTHAVVGYPGVSSAPDVAVTVADDDEDEDDAAVGNPALVASADSLVLTEGGEGSYTLVLVERPTNEVTVSITAVGGAALDVSPPSLTFGVGDWDRPQSVTVAALEDDDGADESGSLTHSATGGGYEGVGAEVAVTVTDNDEASLAVSETSLSLDEGGSASYTVALATRPPSAVTVEIAVSGSAGVELSASSLTFTPSNWSEAQAVTVSANEDDDAVDGTGTLRHAASGGGYDAVAVDVGVSVSDNDEPALNVSAASLSLDEGGSASYEVALATRPPSAVTVEIAASGGAGVGLSASSLTFGADDWDAPQSVTVTALEDDDGVDESGSLTHSATGGGYEGVSAGVTVTVADNDEASLAVSETSLSLDEGGSASYAVALATRPPSAVTVEIAASGGAGVGLSASSLTFGADDWDAPQSVTVTALEDDDGVDESGSLTHSATGGGYEGVSAGVTVTVADNDEASLAVSETSLSLDEGGSASYAVALATRPPSAVTVEIAASGGAGVGLSASSLTFTPSNWSEAQAVTVSANEDDDAADGAGTLRHAASGGGYEGVGAEVAVTVTDNDEPSLNVSAGSLSLDEGGSASYEVALATRPPSAVTVEIAASGGAGVGLSASSLTFGADDWDAPQSVTVTALEDDDGVDESGSLTHSATGGGYEGVSAGVTVTVADNDEASLAVSETSLSLDEGGSASYAVALATRPPSAVTVEIAASGGAGVGLSASSLTFGADDWDAPQSVTVTALEDDDGVDESGSLTHSATGGGYEGVSAGVTVTVADNDEASLAVSETSLSLDEGGSASYAVALATRPPSAVTVEIAASGGAGVGLSASSLTFGADDWDAPQSVTVTALEDDDGVDESGSLTHSATGGGYEGVSAGVTVTVADNDEASLAVSETSLSLDEGGSASYAVALATRPPSAVTVEIAASGGAGVGLSASSLTFTPSNWSEAQAVTVSANEDDDAADGAGTLRHAASGGGYEGVGAEVAVTVTDNDEPSLNVSAGSLSLDEGGSASYEVALATRPPSAVTVEIAASGGAGVGLSASSLTFTPSSWSEAQTVTVSANKDDDRVDETGTLRHAASGGGYDGVSAQVTVSVADDGNAEAVAAISAWNARFGRTVAEHLLEGIGDRVNAKRKALSVPAGDASESGEGSGVSFQAGFAGQNISFAAPTAAPTAMGVDAAGMGPGMGEPGGIPSLGQPKSSSNMFGAAFASSFFEAAGQLADGSYWGAWGRGSFTDLQGTTAAGLRLDGDVLTGQLGADWSNGRMLFGLSLSHSKGDGDYGGDGGREGALESTMTALTPYASVGSEQFSMWGALSAGRGDTMVAPHQGAVIEADTEMDIAAAGLRGQLVNLDNGFGLSILSDAMAMRSSSEETVQLPGIDADVSRVRLSVEGAWIRRMADGGEFSARLEGGLRRDGGDAEEGIGSEISGGLAWTRGGLTFEVEGRTLVTHEDDGFGQTGASAYLAWDPRLASELGPAVSLRQHWGIATGSGLEQMFQMRDLGQFGMESGAARLDAELGWGLPMFGGRFVGTPYLLHGTHQGGRVQTFGWRLGSLDENNALDLSLTVKAMRRVSDTGLSEEGFALGTHLRF